MAPATIITDSTATLTVPYCVRLDSNNNIWVSDDNVNAVYEFPADAAGSTAPTTVLNNAALVTPSWIAFDDNDNLYVLAGSSGGIVYQFAVGATGNDAPITALDASSAGTIGGLAVYGTLNVGTCIPFELQTPSQLLDEGQLAVIRRIFIDINCMVETWLRRTDAHASRVDGPDGNHVGDYQHERQADSGDCLPAERAAVLVAADGMPDESYRVVRG